MYSGAPYAGRRSGGILLRLCRLGLLSEQVVEERWETTGVWFHCCFGYLLMVSELGRGLDGCSDGVLEGGLSGAIRADRRDACPTNGFVVLFHWRLTGLMVEV